MEAKVIKTYLERLTQSEIKTLLICAPFVLVCLIWLLLIEPTHTHNSQLKIQLKAKQAEQQWMLESQHKVSRPKLTPTNQQEINLRQEVNQAFKRFNIKLDRLNNVTEAEISLTLQNVKFNPLISSITSLENKGLTLLKGHITPADQLGNVDANLLFGK